MKISEIELHPIEHLFSTKASNQTEILLSLLDPRFHFPSVMLAVSYYYILGCYGYQSEEEVPLR